MVKLTDLGQAGPDHPIYKGGIQVYTPRTARSLGPKEAKALDDLRQLQMDQRSARRSAQSETSDEPLSDKELGQEA